jgi:hypothetical protein
MGIMTKQVYKKILTYKKLILISALYLTFMAIVLILQSNLHVLIILSLYLVSYYIYVGIKNKDWIFYWAIFALVMMTLDLVVIYSKIEVGLLKTLLAILTAITVYGLIIKCVINLFLLFKKRLSIPRLLSTIRVVGTLLLLDAIFRSIGIQSGHLLTYKNHFKILIIATSVWEYLNVLLFLTFKNRIYKTQKHLV